MLRNRVASSLAARRQRTSSGGPRDPDPSHCNVADQQQAPSSDEEDGLEGGGEGEVEACKEKPWQRVDKEVYEEQLEKLQEQLIHSMVENQTLQSELEDYKKKKKPSASGGSQKEIDQLKQQNASLQRRLRESQSRSSVSSDGTVDVSLSSTTEGGFENVTIRDRISERRKRRQSSLRLSYTSVRESVYSYLALFSEDARTSSDEQEVEATPLTAKRLKDNLSRIAKSSKPWREFFRYVQDVLHWRNTAESLVVFLIYMYCVWNGWILQLVLFIAVIKLTLNYLHISGLAEQFGFGHCTVEEEVEEPLGLADKFQLIKQVAQTVQNQSGNVSDSLEKLRNLLLWRDPEATRQLYTVLWSALIITLFLPNSYTLTFIGLGVGMKIFIVDNIYRKYPKVQEEFDSVDRMWKSLPTDAELVDRQALTQEEVASLQRRSISGDSITLSGGDQQVSDEDTSFCSRFNLPLGEVPFTDWQGGRRCSLMDRERPLMGSKGGRLFLTYSFLCFERSSKTRDPDRMLLSLMDITDIVKAKPFAVLPGSGMALEVTVKSSDKPLMYGAILNRDQALESILEQGLILGLPWGADPDDLSTPDHTAASPSNQQTSSDSASGQT